MSKSNRIVVLGAGESGVGAAVLAQTKGFDVFVSDKGKIADKYKEILNEYKIAWEEGSHTESKILNADEIIKSPGIPVKAPIIKTLIEQGTPIISEIEFAGRYTDAKMVCITGSNGKTTTTLLTYELLKNAGLNVGLAGNVGQSLAYQVATKNYDVYVIELSSFQLDNMYEFKADIAILLNITPDHLDRYEYKFENYINSKLRILQNMTENDHLICSADDPVLNKYLDYDNIKTQVHKFSIEQSIENGAELIGMIENGKKINAINVVLPNIEPFVMNIEEMSLKGKHNVGNSMAATLAARVMGAKKQTIKETLKSFAGVEHRLEVLSYKVRGIQFINDSKATNVNSTWYALESMTTKVVWIVGGTDKGNDYSSLMDLVQDKVKAIVCLGADNKKLLDTFTGVCPVIFDTNSMEDAVRIAYENASKGETVLLSPCCASFDLFKNYEDRGTKFKEAVRNL